MQINTSLPTPRSASEKLPPVVLSLGNFDGFHLGHQALISRVIQEGKQLKEKSAIITFSAHPSTIINPSCPVPLLCTTKQKVRLLSESGIDELYVLDFTQDFSEQSAEDFLLYLQSSLPFSHLILGSDARLGKDRQGDRTAIELLAKKMNFEVEYFPDYMVDGERVSSGRIRSLITKGQFEQVSHLLGRPYSIYAPVEKGSGKGAAMGYPTANIALNGLCLPPFGVYVVHVVCDGKEYRGVANLGLAPTVKTARAPLLEVHLFNQSVDFQGRYFDTRLLNFIRPEKRFDNIDDLKLQIARDVNEAKKLLEVTS